MMVAVRVEVKAEETTGFDSLGWWRWVDAVRSGVECRRGNDEGEVVKERVRVQEFLDRARSSW